MGFWTGQLAIDDEDLIAAYLDLYARAPELIRDVVKREVKAAGGKYLTRLRTEPGPVKYPIRWQSEKQRRAFFATNGFGKGIPTKRSHGLTSGWVLIIDVRANELSEIRFVNSVPYRQYVTGRAQQPFHKVTGWYSEEEVFLDAAIELADRVETAELNAFYRLEG